MALEIKEIKLPEKIYINGAHMMDDKFFFSNENPEMFPDNIILGEYKLVRKVIVRKNTEILGL